MTAETEAEESAEAKEDQQMPLRVNRRRSLFKDSDEGFFRSSMIKGRVLFSQMMLYTLRLLNFHMGKMLYLTVVLSSTENVSLKSSLYTATLLEQCGR